MLNNNKIAIVGDPHLAPTPAGRIDDYVQVGLDKIAQVANNCKHVVFLGDIFSTPKVDEKYINLLITTLIHLKNTNGNVFYSIVGNHDVPNELESKLYNSSLGILVTCGCMNIILPDKPVQIDKYTFNTVPVKYRDVHSFLQNRHYTENDILLIHHEYETGTNVITYNDLRNLGCKNIFFGHDHCPLPQGRIIYPELTVYRSGSLLRNLGTEYNFTRQVYYYVLHNDVVSCCPIQQMDANNIFTQKVLTRENYNKKKFIQSVDSVIEKYKSTINKQVKCSIKGALEELNAPPTVMAYIQQKYEKFGEKFD